MSLVFTQTSVTGARARNTDYVAAKNMLVTVSGLLSSTTTKITEFRTGSNPTGTEGPDYIVHGGSQQSAGRLQIITALVKKGEKYRMNDPDSHLTITDWVETTID